MTTLKPDPQTLENDANRFLQDKLQIAFYYFLDTLTTKADLQCNFNVKSELEAYRPPRHPANDNAIARTSVSWVGGWRERSRKTLSQ